MMRFMNLRHTYLLIVMVTLAGVASAAEEITPFPGKAGDYHGYVAHRFKFDDCDCTVVEPKAAAPGRPWIWRTEFFDHRPMADLALLEKGFHLVHMVVGNTFGCPTAMKHFEAFHAELTGKYKLSAKCVLEGFSRGGLYAYNFAAANPAKVAAIYGDAPVCDFKSWPGGKLKNLGKGNGSAGDWQGVLKCYGFASDEEAIAYKMNPVDNLKPLADAKIPLIHVVGDADDVVPVAENTAVIEERYKALGGEIEVIHKPGVNHHPHSLDDPSPIVEFILKHTTAGKVK